MNILSIRLVELATNVTLRGPGLVNSSQPWTPQCQYPPAAQAWFGRRFKNHWLLTRVVCTRFSEKFNGYFPNGSLTHFILSQFFLNLFTQSWANEASPWLDEQIKEKLDGCFWRKSWCLPSPDDMAKSRVLHFGFIRSTSVPSFIQIPSGTAKLWSGHDLSIFVNISDIYEDIFKNVRYYSGMKWVNTASPAGPVSTTKVHFHFNVHSW